MKRHNVRFGYTWGVNKLAVAELTLGFMLMAGVMALILIYSRAVGADQLTR